jgi:hypothetical protein
LRLKCFESHYKCAQGHFPHANGSAHSSIAKSSGFYAGPGITGMHEDLKLVLIQV